MSADRGHPFTYSSLGTQPGAMSVRPSLTIRVLTRLFHYRWLARAQSLFEPTRRARYEQHNGGGHDHGQGPPLKNPPASIGAVTRRATATAILRPPSERARRVRGSRRALSVGPARRG